MIAFNIEWQPSKALKHLYKALRIGQKYKMDDQKVFSSIYTNLGLIYKNIEQFDSAEYCYQKVIQINKSIGLDKNNVVAYLNMARMQHSIGNASLNLKYAKKCFDLATKEGDELSEYIGYKTMAESLIYIRSLDAARNYAKKARDLCRMVYGNDHSNMAATIHVLFRIEFFSGNYKEALLYAKQAERILVRIYENIHPKLSGTYIYLGKCYYELCQYDSAEHYYQKALVCTRTIQEKNNMARLSAFKSLTECYLAMNNYVQAEKYFKDAIKVEGAHAEVKASLYRDIASYLAKTGQFFESLESYEQAIKVCVNQSAETEYKDPTAASLGNTSLGLLLMQEKALIHENLFNDLNEQKYLIKAAYEYQICDSIIDNFRNNYQNTKDILNYNQATVKVYNGGVRVSKKLYDIFGNSKYKKMAFMFAEKAKSNLLYRSILLQNALQYSYLPDSVLAYEEALKGKITYYLSKINTNLDNDSSRIEYEERLFDVERAHEKFLKKLEVLFPKYYNLKYKNDVLTLQEIQERLNHDVVVEYVLTDESVYVLLITNSDSQIIEMKKPDELDRWVEGLRASVLSRQYQQYQDIAYDLYQKLFEPLEPYLNKNDHIIIVPDGILWYLNFDLLVKNRGTGRPFYELDYLINDYVISYANSANYLFMDEDLPKVKVKNKCLAFSYSSDSIATSSMDFLVLRDFKHDLPGTREEIRSISKLLPGKYYFGSLASEANFKRESQHYSILHLALHGEVSDRDPLFSSLKFSQSDNDTTEDGHLNIYEIYNMNLNSELAVLSACNTGYGKLEKGEGLMSLGRAFQYAGVSSLLISNWGVPDEVAPSVMYDFYKYIKQGMTKSGALRKAKLNYLKSAGIHKSAPFYWGSFVVMGDTSPIEIENNMLNNWVYFIIVISFFAVVLWVSVNRIGQKKANLHLFKK
ncbi:CHAT domain-containing protein [Fulvivirga ulvae]|uniref:CHAT domain-containing protein n=1 Tax=Fulvivirga ulvae TaxID=2904245 RepID=UPI001F453FB7|nr:CHAT domain-containing tetratricopeptide repeat protein [Fulvivirga ulvae]UII33787.1 CHAT domain-containing protein [Fulvivirga ulvae]